MEWGSFVKYGQEIIMTKPQHQRLQEIINKLQEISSEQKMAIVIPMQQNQSNKINFPIQDMPFDSKSSLEALEKEESIQAMINTPGLLKELGGHSPSLPSESKMRKIKVFMEMAKALSSLSVDPSTKVGSFILRPDFTIATSGYNGFVKDCDESYMSLVKPLKLDLILHAEENAIMFKREDLKDYIAIVTHSPCSKCLAQLLQNKVTDIYFDEPGPILRYSKSQKEAVVRLILSYPKVKVRNLEGKSILEFIAESEMPKS